MSQSIFFDFFVIETKVQLDTFLLDLVKSVDNSDLIIERNPDTKGFLCKTNKIDSSISYFSNELVSGQITFNEGSLIQLILDFLDNQDFNISYELINN